MQIKLLHIIFTIVSLFLVMQASGQGGDTVAIDRQNLDEAVVISFKEGGGLTKLPAAVSIITAREIESRRIDGIRDLSIVVPNLFIPDYGSKYTSAVYIRGIGSRLGNSAIGMYVDGMSYLDKTSFDFELFDIKRIEVLRGPQGTLYGRNSMGGLLNVYTLTPWDFQGSKFKVSAGSYGRLQTQLTHYAKPSDKFAFSIGGNYNASDGFVRNQTKSGNKYVSAASIVYPHLYNDNSMGAMQSAALRGTVEWKPGQRLSFAYNASYEYSDQNGYAYGRYNSDTNLPDTVSFDGTAFYRRNLFNSGLKIKYAGKGFDLVATTGYQWLKDSMLLDQDFTPNPVFTLNQNQKINALTEEIVARSSGSGNLKWLGGLSGFYQNLDLQSLVTFGSAGVAMIQGFINSAGIPFPLTITDSSIPVAGSYTMKNYGAAAFVQAGYNNLFIEGLNLSAGLRIDYEKASLEHFTHSTFNYRIQIGPTVRTGTKADTLPHGVQPGKEDIDFMQFLSKFSLQYGKGGNMFYATVSRGYKAGGYNVQMFADLIQGQMRSMSAIEFDFKQAASYKPEFSWNYEVGARFSLKDVMNIGLTAFYLDIRNQQIAQWAPGGQGRMIKNAGHSASKGFEVDATYYPFDGMRLGLAYGYTNNKFVDYTELLNETTEADYKGYYVPFVPRNTLSVNATYTLKMNTCLTDRLIFNAQYMGAGKTYWTEDNSVAQKYYSLFNAKLTAEKGSVSVSLWGRNLMNTSYTTFYFNTFGNAFGQLGKPAIVGADLTIRF